ncbi:hypothetical protein NXV74_16090 [Bacteroides thetaiotaomicron]|nr:hypothetical protein [Bacteroides thetaiotaomicron]
MNGTLDKIRVQFDYLPLINFAMQQNKVSVIHQLSIENMTSEPFRNIQVQITAGSRLRQYHSCDDGSDSRQ